jgi:GntR family transcriptional regulator/MocR family aminotransferase
VGASAGLHVLAWLPPDLGEATVVEAALTAGIRLQGIGPRPGGPTAPAGLTFGYGAITASAIEPGIERLGGVFAAVRGQAA